MADRCVAFVVTFSIRAIAIITVAIAVSITWGQKDFLLRRHWRIFLFTAGHKPGRCEQQHYSHTQNNGAYTTFYHDTILP